MLRQCWIDPSYAGADGYIRTKVDGIRVVGHRAVFEVYNGYLPPVVRHTCDDPRCYNPMHLLPGTKKDNTRDMMERGRGRRPDNTLNRGMPPVATQAAYKREMRARKRAGTWVTRRPV